MLVKTCAGKQVAWDGKALRLSFEHAWEKPGMLHLVTAWCLEDQLCLGQLVVDEKSSEVTAVPVQLAVLDLAGAVVTVDAMNSQKSVAARIVEASSGGCYVMPVKKNHKLLFDRLVPNLNDLVLERFTGVPHTTTDGTDGGRGRIDRRRVWATDQIDWPTEKQRAGRAGLQSVAVVESTRKLGSGMVEAFRRYLITSLPADAAELGRMIRNHRGIENGQPWCLDVGFRQDQSRVRADHGDENLAAIRRIALNLTKHDKRVKLGITNKRRKAGFSPKYLLAAVTDTSNAKCFYPAQRTVLRVCPLPRSTARGKLPSVGSGGGV